jgi:hypothetical protein
MLRPAPHTRYHIAAILAAHWIEFVAQYKRWIRPVVFENVRKPLFCLYAEQAPESNLVRLHWRLPS